MGIRAQEGESRVTQKVSYLGQAGFLKGQFHGYGEPGSVSNCVTGNVFIGERTISLKWMPPLKSLILIYNIKLKSLIIIIKT